MSPEPRTTARPQLNRGSAEVRADGLGKTDALTSTLLTCDRCGGTGLDPTPGVTREDGGYSYIVSCETCHGIEPGPSFASRIKLALSLLSHREPSAHTTEMVVRALHGATLEQLIAWENAA